MRAGIPTAVGGYIVEYVSHVVIATSLAWLAAMLVHTLCEFAAGTGSHLHSTLHA